MEDLIQYLYDHVMEDRMGPLLWASPAYGDRLAALSDARTALETSLSPAQQVLLDTYCTKYDRLQELESQTLFRQGLSLGRRMARL